jgi:hypothetical protein
LVLFFKKEQFFFFEKKKQKTFAHWRTWPGGLRCHSLGLSAGSPQGATPTQTGAAQISVEGASNHEYWCHSQS